MSKISLFVEILDIVKNYRDTDSLLQRNDKPIS
jgi:hypothetical protein